MTFTPAELRRLHLADLADGLTTINPKGGRPRKPCPDQKTATRRAAWRAYEDRKHNRVNAFGEPRRRGGRPRSAPDAPRQQKARLRALQRYYRLKSTSTTKDQK